MAGEREINYVFKATENVTSVSARVQKALKGARKSESSEALEEIGKIGKGGGALVGVELVARGLDKLADSMAELHEQSKRGAIGWAEYTDAVFKSIPALGGVYEAVRKIRFGQQEADEAQQQAASDALSAVRDSVFKQSQVAGKEGIELARVQARQEIQAQIKAIEDVRAANKEGLSVTQNAQLNSLESRVKKEGKDKLIKIEQDYYNERSKVIADGEAKGRQMKAESDAQVEEYAGHKLKATLIRIKSERDQAVRGIKESFDAQLKVETDPARKQQLFQQRGSQANEAERARRIKEGQAQEENRLDLNQKRFDLTDRGVDALRTEGQLGNAAAARDAERLQIISDFAKKRQEINDLLAKENLAPEARNLLGGILGGLGAQEKASLARLGIGKSQFSGGLAPTQESSFLTGVAAAGRENDPANRIAKSNEANEKHLAAIRTGIETIVKTPAPFVVK